MPDAPPEAIDAFIARWEKSGDHFGKRTKARIQQISEILKTLEELGKL